MLSRKRIATATATEKSVGPDGQRRLVRQQPEEVLVLPNDSDDEDQHCHHYSC
jgi:hypothetical protein